MPRCRLCCLLLCLVPALARADVQRHALLVSLEHYPDGTVIPGAHGMADALAQRLVTSFGFAAADIHFLRDQAATKAGLFQAIHDRLVQGLDADDVAVLWFAGHGSRIQDFNDDEDDGFDEVLCLWDVDDDPLIDDELPPVLSTVPALGFTVLLDCCHSGTATRSTPQDGELLLPLFQVLPPDVVPTHPDQGSDRPAAPANYTVLSACRAGELAIAVQSRRDGNYLVFTKALIDSLGETEPPVDYATALGHLRQRITAMNKVPPGIDGPQQPQLEGPDVHRPIFASVTASAAPAWLDELTVACDNEPLRQACGEPDGGLWSTAPDQATLRVLAKEGNGWECRLLDREGQELEANTSPTVNDAGAWLRQAIARERLMLAASRLDAPLRLPLRVTVEGDQMLVESTAPDDWRTTIVEIVPTGELLVLCPSPLFTQTGREATFVARAPEGRAMVYAVATPRALELPELATDDLPPGQLRQLAPAKALAFLRALGEAVGQSEAATASWVAATG